MVHDVGHKPGLAHLFLGSGESGSVSEQCLLFRVRGMEAWHRFNLSFGCLQVVGGQLWATRIETPWNRIEQERKQNGEKLNRRSKYLGISSIYHIELNTVRKKQQSDDGNTHGTIYVFPVGTQHKG